MTTRGAPRSFPESSPTVRFSCAADQADKTGNRPPARVWS
jgi:hypothetical protein